MPKAKRRKPVTFNKTPKRRVERKQQLVVDVKKAVNDYAHIWVVRHHGAGSNTMQELRRRWNCSRVFVGKNKVMAIALGRDEAEEMLEGLHQLSARVEGQCLLFFTNAEPEEVESFFKTYEEIDFCRAGEVAPKTITLDKGIIPGFSHAIEPRLRRLGLHTKLKMGEVELLQDTAVCTEGEVLSPEQCQILRPALTVEQRLLEERISVFRFTVDCHYNKDTSEFVPYYDTT